MTEQREVSICGECSSDAGSSLENYTSFYRKQFQELSEIGNGGFGYVFKAKHLLDEIIYAIKKIYIDQNRSEEYMKCLEEVKILAQLNHPNVVAYKHAWIDKCTECDLQSLQTLQSCSQTETTNDIQKCISNFNMSSSNSRTNTPIMSQDEAFENSENYNPQILYIQMSLCHQNLREWMNVRGREFSETSEINEIITQILSGLNYIHSRGIIHHDIKPQNIFISMEYGKLSVQLGDFGLACGYQKDHSEEIGTKMYVAPEQLDKKCDPKSDVYSCGIILFELLYPMMTEMERCREINDMKNNNLPPGIEERYPQLVYALIEAVQICPNLRPSANDLLGLINPAENLQIVSKLAEENAII